MAEEPTQASPIEEIKIEQPTVDHTARLEVQNLEDRRSLELQHEKFKQALRTQTLGYRKILFWGAITVICLFFAISAYITWWKIDAIGYSHNYLILAGLPAILGVLIALALVRIIFGSQETKEENTGTSVLLELAKEMNKLKS